MRQLSNSKTQGIIVINMRFHLAVGLNTALLGFNDIC
jgi:hypothetical protein